METDHRDSGFDAMEKTPICALSQICHKYDLRVVTHRARFLGLRNETY